MAGIGDEKRDAERLADTARGIVQIGRFVDKSLIQGAGRKKPVECGGEARNCPAAFGAFRAAMSGE